MRFPAPSSHWPTGREMGDYLEAYARRFDLPVRSGTRVDRVEPVDGGFVVSTADGARLAARQVIVATGPFREPNVPAFAGELDPSIRQLHSHEYRNPAQLQDGPVLVVGLSHSGADIAFEAANAGHRTILSGKSHGQMPIRVTDSKRAMLGWPVVEFVFGHVLTMRTPMGRKMRPRGPQGRRPAPAGPPPGPGPGRRRAPRREDGRRPGRPADARRRHRPRRGQRDLGDRLPARLLRSSRRRSSATTAGRSRSAASARRCPGLYFLGVPFQYAFSSMLVAGAGRDARYVVDRIAERVAASARSAQPTAAVGRPDGRELRPGGRAPRGRRS